MYNLKNIRDIRNIQNQSYEFEKLEKLIEIYEDESAHKLLNIVEDTKISLTDMDIVEKQIDFLSNKPKFTIKKDCFENSIQENIERIEKVALETINKAQITKENIDLIILTGGSTEIPYIQNRFIKLFPNAIISNNEKLSSVGLGLGFDAKRKFL